MPYFEEVLTREDRHEVEEIQATEPLLALRGKPIDAVVLGEQRTAFQKVKNLIAGGDIEACLRNKRVQPVSP